MTVGKDVEKVISRPNPADSGSQLSLAIGLDLEKDNVDEPVQAQEQVQTSANLTVSRYETRTSQRLGGPAGRVRTAQDWDGPDDPENPHNWSTGKRIWHTVPPALLSFSV